MGGGHWEPSKWDTYSSTHIASKASAEDIYSKALVNELDVKGIKFRESCDSAEHPRSRPIICALDLTGSMDPVLEMIARQGLPVFAQSIYDKKPLTDPQIMFMGIGDVEYDEAPVQATQFESDIRIAEQLTKLYLEEGGGGNDYESYIAAWYFAAYHTKLDCAKRGEKGYLFTIGDEEVTPFLSRDHIEEFFGDKIQPDKYTAQQLYDAASKYYHIYHIIIKEGRHCHHDYPTVKKSWNKILGQNAVTLDDYKKLAEVMVSIIQLNEGVDKKDIIAGWDGTTSVTVASAISGLSHTRASTTGVIKL